MTCMVFINSKVKLFNVDTSDGKTNYKVEDNLVKMNGDKKLEENVQYTKDPNNTIPTPKSLVHRYSLPYNENLEVPLAEEERLSNTQERAEANASTGHQPRSFSQNGASNSFADSASDTSEVNKIFKRRKKTGHNWTRRKGAKSAPRSLRSTSRKRSASASTHISSFSNSSLTSRRSRSSSRKSPKSVSTSIRGRSSRWTRSLSRAIEEESQFMSNLFHCHVEECYMECDSIDEMNQHNVDEHKMLQNYFCCECRQSYTLASLLAFHKEEHYSSSVYCLMCGIKQSNTRELQKHLDLHMEYSVPCNYCDKSFLSKGITEKHVYTKHKKRRKRLISRDRLILDRIDKSDND